MSLPVPLYALVVEEELRTAKTGNHFWQVILKTQAGNVKAFMWVPEQMPLAILVILTLPTL